LRNPYVTKIHWKPLFNNFLLFAVTGCYAR
jgi:hypothetical protein